MRMGTEKMSVDDFIQEFNETPARDRFLTNYIFKNTGFSVEVNGIHIEDLKTNNNTLYVTTSNNRKMEFRLNGLTIDKCKSI